MNFERDPKIEELLNAFIDSELSNEQCDEVQRLVEKDVSIARRLQELERCRLLVSSLPPAEPPAEVVSGIKELVRDKWAQGVRFDYAEQRGSTTSTTLRTGSFAASRGRWHLFARQVLAASVIIGLAGLFGAVVYRIVGPEGVAPMTVAVKPELAVTTPPVETAEAAGDTGGAGIYSLRLLTSDFTAVDAFINKLLEQSTWLRYETAKELPERSVYTVYCSRSGLEELMTDMAPVWSRFDSATFVVHTDSTGNYVAIAQARPEQIADIARKDTVGGRVRLAKEFAIMNNLEQVTSAERVLATAKRDYPELTTIPRPVLTSGEKRATSVSEDPADHVRVDLTIVVTGSGPSTTLRTGSLTTGGHK